MSERACEPSRLLQRAASGDPALLEDLFSCYRGELLAFLQKRCGSRGDADDAVQDAFEAAARYLSGFRGEAPLKSWLYRLASSACTRMRRGGKNDAKRHSELDEGALPALPEIAARMEAAVEARLSPLRSALESLSPTDRAVLLMRDGEQLSAREVAANLKLTESAVKARLHRARRAIRQQLDEE